MEPDVFNVFCLLSSFFASVNTNSHTPVIRRPFSWGLPHSHKKTEGPENAHFFPFLFVPFFQGLLFTVEMVYTVCARFDPVRYPFPALPPPPDLQIKRPFTHETV